MPRNEPRNTRVFNLVVSKLLSDLRESFPNPVDIDPATVGAAVTDSSAEYDEMFEDIHVTARNSIRYLLRQGIIRQEAHYPTWDGPIRELVLSDEGLRLLDSVPDSVDSEKDRRTFAQRMAESLAGGRAGVASQLAQECISAYQNRNS